MFVYVGEVLRASPAAVSTGLSLLAPFLLGVLGARALASPRSAAFLAAVCDRPTEAEEFSFSPFSVLRVWLLSVPDHIHDAVPSLLFLGRSRFLVPLARPAGRMRCPCAESVRACPLPPARAAFCSGRSRWRHRACTRRPQVPTVGASRPAAASARPAGAPLQRAGRGLRGPR